MMTLHSDIDPPAGYKIRAPGWPREFPRTTPMALSASRSRTQGRQIAQRTRGTSHGNITRLMSPSDFGEILKPFVFLDLFDNDGVPFSGFRLHPHSGIATLTYISEGSV